MARTGAGIQDLLGASRRPLGLPDDPGRERVEVSRTEELGAVPELRRAIPPAAGLRLPPDRRLT